MFFSSGDRIFYIDDKSDRLGFNRTIQERSPSLSFFFLVCDRLFLGLERSHFFIRKSSSKILEITVFKNPLDDGSSPWQNVERLPQGEIVVDSLGGFDLSQATNIDPETFPKSNEFLQNLLDGKFEFPAEGEPGAYFLAAGKSGNDIGDLREEAVRSLVGGTLAKDSKGNDIGLFAQGASETVYIDVIGPNGELILVGGPAKANNLSKLGGVLKNLKIIANERGVEAQHYFSDNTPNNVIEFARKRLGAANVKTFPEVVLPK